jgi:hypothetical protein
MISGCTSFGHDAQNRVGIIAFTVGEIKVRNGTLEYSAYAPSFQKRDFLKWL